MNGPQKSESPAATGQTQEKSTDTAIVASQAPTNKEYWTAQAKFALRAHTLNRSYRAEDGRVTYIVGRWTHSRAFSHWHDVEAYLKQIGGQHE